MVEIPGCSRELCGGTHTHRTGDIGVFTILQETSIAAGVRRIEALCGRRAVEHLKSQQEVLARAAALLKAAPADVADRLEKLLVQQRQLEKEIEALKTSQASRRSADLLETAEEIGGVKVLVARVEAEDPKALREMCDRFRERFEQGVLVLGAASGEKAFLLAGVTPALTAKVHAGELIKGIVKEIGGSGGGRPDMAQAGGNRPEKLDDALDLARKLIGEKIG